MDEGWYEELEWLEIKRDRGTLLADELETLLELRARLYSVDIPDEET